MRSPKFNPLSHLRWLLVTLCMLLLTVSFSQEVARLVFRQNDSPNEVAGLAEAIEQWNADNPDIQVSFETVPWSDALNQYVREVQAGGGPDVIQSAFVWTRDLAESGLVTNLDSFIEASADVDINDFLGTDLGVYEDSVYGMPWTVDTQALIYRPDLLEEAGLEVPDSWEDLLNASRALTKDTDGNGRIDQYGFCFPAGSGSSAGMWFIANYYLWSNGNFFVEQADTGEWRVGVTEEDVADAIRYFNTYFEEGLTPESMQGVNSSGDPEYVGALGRGDCVFTMHPPFSYAVAQEQSEAQLLSAEIPRGSETRISHLGGRALVMNPNTEHPEAAWKFLNFLLTKEFYQTGYSNYFPAQETLLGELPFPEPLEGYAKMLPQAITFNQYIVSPAPVSGMWAATNQEFGAVYAGLKTPEEAAADLIGEIEELLAN